MSKWITQSDLINLAQYIVKRVKIASEKSNYCSEDCPFINTEYLYCDLFYEGGNCYGYGYGIYSMEVDIEYIDQGAIKRIDKWTYQRCQACLKFLENK